MTFTNVAITNPAQFGFVLYGDGFTQTGSVSNVAFNNVTVGSAGEGGVSLTGQLENLAGNVSSTGTGPACSTYYYDLVQGPGSSFSINGNVLAEGMNFSCD